MIRFQLTCDNNHSFDSWFASSAAYDTLKSAGMVACTTCGSTRVEKALMAPAVAVKNPLSTPNTQAESDIAALREKIESTSEYVGLKFDTEARAIHSGEKPERSIYGQADGPTPRKLIEDGIPVLPLPFTPRKKAN